MSCKAVGYDSVEKFLGENQINADNFRLRFGEQYTGRNERPYPNRITLEYEHEDIVSWDTIEWGDARVLLYLYLVAVYYPRLIEAYNELSAERQKLSGQVYDLEQELKAARETIARQEAQLTEIREAANP